MTIKQRYGVRRSLLLLLLQTQQAVEFADGPLLLEHRPHEFGEGECAELYAPLQEEGDGAVRLDPPQRPGDLLDLAVQPVARLGRRGVRVAVRGRSRSRCRARRGCWPGRGGR